MRPRLFISLLFAALAGPWAGSAQLPSETPGAVEEVEVRGAVQSFYNENDLKPCAIMKVDWIHKDFQHVGFFRVGALPVVAVEGLSFEVQTPALAANSFSFLQENFMQHGRALSRVELRHPVFLLDTPAPHRLECGRAVVSPDGRWKLSGGVRLVLGTKVVRAARASLQATGENAGRLVLAGTRVSLNFFSTNLVLRPSLDINPL